MLNRLERLLEGFLALLMISLVASVTWQVFSRYALSQPSPWTEEAARFLLIWISILGAAHAFQKRAHLAIDLLPRRLSAKPRAVLESISAALVGIFSALVMVVGGGHLVLLTWELNQISPALGVPIAAVYSVLPLSGLLLLVFTLFRALDTTPSNAPSQEAP